MSYWRENVILEEFVGNSDDFVVELNMPPAGKDTWFHVLEEILLGEYNLKEKGWVRITKERTFIPRKTTVIEKEEDVLETVPWDGNKSTEIIRKLAQVLAHDEEIFPSWSREFCTYVFGNITRIEYTPGTFAARE